MIVANCCLDCEENDLQVRLFYDVVTLGPMCFTGASGCSGSKIVSLYLGGSSMFCRLPTFLLTAGKRRPFLPQLSDVRQLLRRLRFSVEQIVTQHPSTLAL